MSEVERAARRMKELGVTTFSYTPGTNPDSTSDQVATEINKALDQLQSGDFEVVELD